MASTATSNDKSSLTEMWKNYFGVWISPPSRVISWLSFLPVTDGQSENEKYKPLPKLILLRPLNEVSDRLEQLIEDSFNKPEYLSHGNHQMANSPPDQKTFEDEMLLFAFSATDPLGQQVSPEENRRMNASLWKDLLEFKKTTEMKKEHEVFLFHGAGFIDDGTDWIGKRYKLDYQENEDESHLFDFVESNFPYPEKGFLVAISTVKEIKDLKPYQRFPSNESNEVSFKNSGGLLTQNWILRNEIVKLARKYQQGGIFEFTKGIQNNLIRSTVPVCIPDCQSRTELELFPLQASP